ncbi:UDP-N-acetyl-D-mannosaminuronic acid dehydrogenase [[Brevibacterium] flavum]|uniref:UDP-N-acetyl-D-mannosaminuronic acid dehydrogenase n=1 Tax=[Brevibacterium] flavum TaxID=92706 RepID=A0A0F6Z3V2_9CORY|nr:MULTISPECIES: UDP-N-acetyl-D-mannosamine dehydrogenase [Corynebacterium]AKF26418.1 UDP-N-acetyl-D-mannosaminuronic acid dehydrogenase [[Brevibacterium] flavum]AST19652.1 UDP-N-acetyl-D-mannosamine dehydrogenase [Corynebacterium glutamicum ATCC 14067]KEI22106.1 UDP-N-acetyl-D-mannosaminuronic acid dehydrogenase [Corynebacterium glutamicum ATCC 14067]
MSSTAGALDYTVDVCVIGLGYIGLPTAAFMASKGLKVLGVDVNQTYVDKINNSEVPFYEPGFSSLLKDVVSSKSLSAQTTPIEADSYIVAVPTPFNDDKTVDTSYIDSAARSLAPFLRPKALVVLESTAAPGTTEHMANVLIDERPDLSLDPESDNHILIAHCPERVLPGKIMEEMESNARVVGGINSQSSRAAERLYRSFCTGEILVSNARTAEMAKLAENSFRDVNIAFANELSIVCESLDINVWELISLANHHPRVNILQPGPGVGGHCIAVDPWFIVSSAPTLTPLIRTAREVNDGKPNKVLDKVKELVKGIPSPTIAALGIAFKADIDDLRESPSLSIVEQLAQSELRINVVEPNISVLPSSLSKLSNVELSKLDDAIVGADLVLVLVDHTPFKAVDHSRFANKIVVDTKGIWNN